MHATPAPSWGLPRRSAIGAVALAATLIGMPSTFAQGLLDDRLIGTWIKVGTAERIVIKTNGDIVVEFPGEASVFNGTGSIERCSDGGANVCLVGGRFRCAYRYIFSDGGMNLQFRTGRPDVACTAASGDFRRRD